MTNDRASCLNLSDEQEDLWAGGVTKAALPGRCPFNCGGADGRQGEGRHRQQPQRAAASARFEQRPFFWDISCNHWTWWGSKKSILASLKHTNPLAPHRDRAKEMLVLWPCHSGRWQEVKGLRAEKKLIKFTECMLLPPHESWEAFCQKREGKGCIVATVTSWHLLAIIGNQQCSKYLQWGCRTPLHDISKKEFSS